MKQEYRAIGIMSGTSLDGLDVAHCSFVFSEHQVTFSINAAETFTYSNEWIKKLRHLPSASALEFCTINNAFGHYLGRLVKDFVQKHNLQTNIIGSHGHTIFHAPQQGFTVQIGSGAAIAAETGLPTVCDFRSLDVALGGQGAPLVPIGDQLLFSQFDACLNIGGFSNISFEQQGKRIAYDISPANFILNHYTQLQGKLFDENGEMARSGEMIPELFDKLNHLDFYNVSGPKSLGSEWVNSRVFPITDKYTENLTDLMATLTWHIAFQIARHLPAGNHKQVLVTGGGAFNTFLIDCIKDFSSTTLIVPGEELVNYKEALIFALLAVLRLREEDNCLSGVTGSQLNNCGGALWLPPKVL
ncbi:anhydro-N-acetylmuramic acid kinase [Lentimicrobium sp.]